MTEATPQGDEVKVEIAIARALDATGLLGSADEMDVRDFTAELSRQGYIITRPTDASPDKAVVEAGDICQLIPDGGGDASDEISAPPYAPSRHPMPTDNEMLAVADSAETVEADEDALIDAMLESATNAPAARAWPNWKVGDAIKALQRRSDAQARPVDTGLLPCPPEMVRLIEMAFAVDQDGDNFHVRNSTRIPDGVAWAAAFQGARPKDAPGTPHTPDRVANGETAG